MADRPIDTANDSGEPSSNSRFRTFAGTISTGMEVISSEGELIGHVDLVQGDHIVLAPSKEGEPSTYFVPLSLIDGITEEQILLASRGDGTFGLGATP